MIWLNDEEMLIWKREWIEAWGRGFLRIDRSRIANEAVQRFRANRLEGSIQSFETWQREA